MDCRCRPSQRAGQVTATPLGYVCDDCLRWVPNLSVADPDCHHDRISLPEHHSPIFDSLAKLRTVISRMVTPYDDQIVDIVAYLLSYNEDDAELDIEPDSAF